MIQDSSVDGCFLKEISVWSDCWVSVEVLNIIDSFLFFFKANTEPSPDASTEEQLVEKLPPTEKKQQEKNAEHKQVRD